MNILNMRVGIVFIFLTCNLSLLAKEYAVESPDGRIQVSFSVDKKIYWSAAVNGYAVFNKNEISLDLGNEVLGLNSTIAGAEKSATDEIVHPVVPLKSASIRNSYNQLRLSFSSDFIICFRVFNNGFAYRFETRKGGEITVYDEAVQLNFTDNFPVLFPEEESLLSHYERLYVDEKMAILGKGRFCSLPMLVKADNNIKIAITEADLYDYPGLFLETTGSNSLVGKFPHRILEHRDVRDRTIAIEEEADYIAVTQGSRAFPWRVFMVSEKDAELIGNEMVFLLSRGNKINDHSWIKPGLVAWDWWNDNNIYGVDFKSGINNNTYKYYIDFASKYDIPYVILDEGWSKTTLNVLETNPEIDIKGLVEYGKSKNVDLILWSLWGPLDSDMDAILNRFQEWGVKGVKVDFMQRADQYMVNFYERLAKACAERRLLVNYHGSFKPSGLRRAYPNVLNYEGVKGLENCKRNAFATPEHDLNICFTRMLSGMMDYTPGAMRNYNKTDFSPSYSNPGSMGTRCHQLAMYVVYEAPLQMLSDSPSNYYREPECADFISKMKTVWDETRVLKAKVGDYILIARRSGKDWYIGGLTDFDERSFEMPLSFLGAGNYQMEIMEDGLNTEKMASDYKRTVKKVNSASVIQVLMASGGGWAAICKKLD